MSEKDQGYNPWPAMTLLIVVVLCATAIAVASILK